MIRAHRLENGKPKVDELSAESSGLPEGTVWIDLVRPDQGEEDAVETWLGIGVPTREEMKEIEASSRLYQDEGVWYLTASLVTKADTKAPESTVVTFILVGNHLVTLRYAEPMAFEIFERQVERHAELIHSAESAFLGLLEAIADRLADVLEVVGADLESVSQEIFAEERRLRGRDYERMLTRIGKNGDLASKARESLVSLDRMQTFVRQIDEVTKEKGIGGRLKTLARDLSSLTDYTSFLNNKINFLLDATLGMIGIEQNATIKIFSVVAVIFLPPTLIASIYGMNFELMPELGWPFGYPVALALMVVSAILPYLFFKRKGWL